MTRTPRSKYRNVPTVVDGKRFASKKEGRRYAQLLLMLKAGEIDDLECHPVYHLDVNGTRVGKYTADFRYKDKRYDWAVIVEDVKSSASRTTAYMLRKRLVKAIHGVTIKET